MSVLNDVINAALREHNVQQVGSTGASPLVDVLRTLLAPRSVDRGASPDESHIEPDALQQLLARFQAGGYRDVIRSWIGTGANQPIEPHQLGQALGEQKSKNLRGRRACRGPRCSMSLHASSPPLLIASPRKARCQLERLQRHDVEETDRA